jgi:hypothetical protein
MPSIPISSRSDSGEKLASDLLNILKGIESEITGTIWKAEDVKCLGKALESLHSLSNSGEYFSGRCLLELASRIYQIIDGKFYGYKETNLGKP